jgi:uncharacterized protein (DUF1697 family)
VKRWAALLRGVNVGGNRKLPMADLRRVAEGLGYTGVATLLASGNLVFSAEGSAPALEAALEEALAGHGLDTDVLVRDAAELDAILAANPFAEAASARPNHLVVVFHREPVSPEPLARLAEIYQGPERLEPRGHTLFIDYPEGIGHSELNPAMAKARFAKVATGRNWNSVTKLAAMLAG